MSSILPPYEALQMIEARYETADHTEADLESLIDLAKLLQTQLEDEKARNFNLEMDNFFLRGGQIPNQ